MSITIDFTYQTTTPESAENGDFESHGFITAGGWKFEPENYERQVWKRGDLAGIIAYAQQLGITHDGDAFYSVDPDQDYVSGADTTYAMHIDGCSASTELRIARLLDS